jgi:hypothetical protein
MTDFQKGQAQAFDQVEAYLLQLREHASSRIQHDGSELDIRQIARRDTAKRALEWLRAAKKEALQ